MPAQALIQQIAALWLRPALSVPYFRSPGQKEGLCFEFFSWLHSLRSSSIWDPLESKLEDNGKKDQEKFTALMAISTGFEQFAISTGFEQFALYDILFRVHG